MELEGDCPRTGIKRSQFDEKTMVFIFFRTRGLEALTYFGKAICEEIFKKHIFGQVKALMYFVEFQKRGLPHANILIILEDDYKLNKTDDYDEIISAEIPDPDLHLNYTPLLFEL